MPGLDKVEWGTFKINEIFDIELSKGDNQLEKLEIGKIPLVSSGISNNGIVGFIKRGDGKAQKFSKGVLTVDMFGQSFYHTYDFYSVSHGRVNMLNPILEVHEAGFFLAQMLNQQLDCFSYNNMASSSRLSIKNIKLPITPEKQPDWNYMEQYVINIMDSIEVTEIEAIKTTQIRLDSVEWKEFSIQSITESIKSGNDWEAYNRPEGENPFIGASALNNGITDFVDFSTKENYVGENVIGVNRNGNVGYAFYHPYRAYFSGDTRFIKLKNFPKNKYINLFITTMIMQQKDKYAYGYKMGTKRLTAQKILLPVTSNNRPNWRFMEDYIKSISNSDLI
nr:restriction endonuclease subunit S [Clostridioides mangenotii]